jgi:hypothetical protein
MVSNSFLNLMTQPNLRNIVYLKNNLQRMKRFFDTILIIALVLNTISCTEEDPILEDSEGFYLEYGTECGWCAGHRYIEISEGIITYTFNIPCGENKGTVTMSRNLTTEEWQAIQDAFDYDFLLSLNYNECRVCADGCDEIIRINDESDMHEIRYNPGEEIEGIEELQNILFEIMEEFIKYD